VVAGWRGGEGSGRAGGPAAGGDGPLPDGGAQASGWVSMIEFTEQQACTPGPVDKTKFNPSSVLPYGLTTEQIYHSMVDFVDFLGFVNYQLSTKNISRLESFLMPANFSSLVGEFLNMTIPKYCVTLAKNRFHNGHPDLIPSGHFPNNAVQYATEGIEVKASRHSSRWQGHNPEEVWLMVFQFDSNSASNVGAKPRPFVFKGVYAAKLEKSDWAYSGRSATSRRTITASVGKLGIMKMKANWVYSNL
jgi:hypothetical protein